MKVLIKTTGGIEKREAQEPLFCKIYAAPKLISVETGVPFKKICRCLKEHPLCQEALRRKKKIGAKSDILIKIVHETINLGKLKLVENSNVEQLPIPSVVFLRKLPIVDYLVREKGFRSLEYDQLHFNEAVKAYNIDSSKIFFPYVNGHAVTLIRRREMGVASRTNFYGACRFRFYDPYLGKDNLEMSSDFLIESLLEKGEKLPGIRYDFKTPLKQNYSFKSNNRKIGAFYCLVFDPIK